MEGTLLRAAPAPGVRWLHTEVALFARRTGRDGLADGLDLLARRNRLYCAGRVVADRRPGHAGRSFLAGYSVERAGCTRRPGSPDRAWGVSRLRHADRHPLCHGN